jgi:hypothetical protein
MIVNKKLKKIKIVALFILIFSSAFNVEGQKKRFINAKPLSQLEDSDSLNVLNSDNRIFKSKRIFTYSVKNISPLGSENYFYLFFNPDCRTDKQKQCIDWSIGIRNTSDTNNYIIDTVKLFVHQGVSKIMPEMSKQQTIIRYEYFNEDGRIFMGELSGVIEDSTRIFLHPPRSHGFVLNELNPFPQVKLPIQIEATWKKELYISNNFLKKTKIKELENLDGIFINFTYKIEKSFILNHRLFGKIKCYKISGQSEKYFWGQTSIDMDFSPDFGFVNIEYKNYDNSKTCFSLENIN